MKIKLLRPDVKVPQRQTLHSGGYDLHAYLDGSLWLHTGRPVQINTMLQMEIPEGHVGLIVPRSGLGTKHGINIANTVPVIDSDYRGEVLIYLVNRNAEPYEVKNGDRIAQLLIVPVSTPDIEVVEELSETDRGSGGFGSTGT